MRRTDSIMTHWAELFRQYVLDPLQQSHPAWWIAAMILLPLVGCPITPLWVGAGLRFGPYWGSAAAIVCIAGNVSAAYWLAARLLSEPIRRWLERGGRKIPELSKKDELKFILIFRITPGIPLVVQNYVLGCARVNFLRYLFITLPIHSAYAIGFVVFGSALTQSSAWKIALAAGLVVAVILAVSLLRNRFKQPTANQPP